VATPASIIAAIDAKVAAVIADPDAIASYRIGDKQVSRSEILEYLLKAREVYSKANVQTPAEDIRHFAFDFDEFGREESEYIGDSE